jgi:hypothetical protein
MQKANNMTELFANGRKRKVILFEAQAANGS